MIFQQFYYHIARGGVFSIEKAQRLLNNRCLRSNTTRQEIPKRTSCFSYARNQKENIVSAGMCE